MADKHTAAFRKGYWDTHQSQGEADNPHRPGTFAYHDWQEGAAAAAAELRSRFLAGA